MEENIYINIFLDYYIPHSLIIIEYHIFTIIDINPS